eukprot:Protomagalhaensia_sp_Gyna_25__1024@NODE_1495_length_1786_cov_878_041214_g1210_i0_p2_GENE_NODE_1495_length_1786_cov_878_041214_g1210_i0NODE_1495_length_1786_cov_878_041214_g1210_i0_p2_ORF_typecomplete_len213_score50_06NAC/PF01849_18/1_4e06VASP_tetra/PF08776_11/0_085_NODE_1495_length_1786_cov_878_041214_g1210_i093641
MAAAQEEGTQPMENPIEEVREDTKPEADVSVNRSRAEKKVLKQLQKLGLKQVNHFSKCEIRRGRQYPIVVNQPIVFEVQGKVPTYIILGQIRVDDLKEQLRALSARQQAVSANAGMAPTVVKVADNKATDAPPADEEVDTTGLNEDDITLAMQQTGKSKARVVAELRKAKGDLIEAIMQLSS